MTGVIAIPDFKSGVNGCAESECRTGARNAGVNELVEGEAVAGKEALKGRPVNAELEMIGREPGEEFAFHARSEMREEVEGLTPVMTLAWIVFSFRLRAGSREEERR